ncbi:MAG: hypothetical protein IJJ13_05260 [Lachnospiraceae bacterium]|nr:hypothetical protein [Lachnospiraceae bacterium]
MKRSNTAAITFNAAIFGMTVFGYLISVFFPQQNRLPATGALGLRYFTTLSNFFAGAVALITLIYLIRHREKTGLPVALARLKLISASSVMVTFFVVVAFLGPVYGFEKLYAGSNFFFHLVIPLAAMADYCFAEKVENNPFRDTAFATIPVLLYGAGYLTNIAINGVGVWPDTNDWYGFTTWGMPMAFVIFGGITFISWIMAVIMRGIHRIIP